MVLNVTLSLVLNFPLIDIVNLYAHYWNLGKYTPLQLILRHILIEYTNEFMCLHMYFITVFTEVSPYVFSVKFNMYTIPFALFTFP